MMPRMRNANEAAMAPAGRLNMPFCMSLKIASDKAIAFAACSGCRVDFFPRQPRCAVR
jgi:hypothetical protein